MRDHEIDHQKADVDALEHFSATLVPLTIHVSPMLVMIKLTYRSRCPSQLLMAHLRHVVASLKRPDVVITYRRTGRRPACLSQIRPRSSSCSGNKCEHSTAEPASSAVPIRSSQPSTLANLAARCGAEILNSTAIHRANSHAKRQFLN
jgi:hypothetical protein